MYPAVDRGLVRQIYSAQEIGPKMAKLDQAATPRCCTQPAYQGLRLLRRNLDFAWQHLDRDVDAYTGGGEYGGLLISGRQQNDREPRPTLRGAKPGSASPDPSTCSLVNLPLDRYTHADAVHWPTANSHLKVTTPILQRRNIVKHSLRNVSFSLIFHPASCMHPFRMQSLPPALFLPWPRHQKR
jgi:hypothetical protein